MATLATITHLRVNKTPTAPLKASACTLAAFAQINTLIATGIAADGEVVHYGDLSMLAYADDAADVWARCQTAVTVFTLRPDVDPILAAAARQIDSLLRDRGETTEVLNFYPLTVLRLADRCMMLRTEWSRMVAAELHRTVELLSALVVEAVAAADLATDDAAFLSIPETLTV